MQHTATLNSKIRGATLTDTIMTSGVFRALPWSGRWASVFTRRHAQLSQSLSTSIQMWHPPSSAQSFFLSPGFFTFNLLPNVSQSFNLCFLCIFSNSCISSGHQPLNSIQINFQRKHKIKLKNWAAPPPRQSQTPLPPSTVPTTSYLWTFPCLASTQPHQNCSNKGNLLIATSAKSFLWAAAYLTDLCNCLPFPHHLVWALLLTRSPLFFLLCLYF